MIARNKDNVFKISIYIRDSINMLLRNNISIIDYSPSKADSLKTINKEIQVFVWEPLLILLVLDFLMLFIIWIPVCLVLSPNTQETVFWGFLPYLEKISPLAFPTKKSHFSFITWVPIGNCLYSRKTNVWKWLDELPSPKWHCLYPRECGFWVDRILLDRPKSPLHYFCVMALVVLSCL